MGEVNKQRVLLRWVGVCSVFYSVIFKFDDELLLCKSSRNSVKYGLMVENRNLGGRKK